MPSITFSNRARQDIIAIGNRIAKENPAAARDMVRHFHQTAARLSDYPHLGPQKPELGNNRRYLVVKRYLIVYKILPDNNIRILRVVHDTRYLPTLI